MTRIPIQMAIALAMAIAVPAGGCLSPRAPAAHPGELAPDFELENYDGSTVRLTEVLAADRPIVLVFYRGHW